MLVKWYLEYGSWRNHICAGHSAKYLSVETPEEVSTIAVVENITAGETLDEDNLEIDDNKKADDMRDGAFASLRRAGLI